MRRLLLLVVGAGAPALAQEEPPVRSQVVAEGTVIQNKRVPQGASGLTIDPRRETAEKAARIDAETIERNGSVLVLRQPAQPAETNVSVQSIVVERKSSDATSCVQVGVIGARPDCRPQR